MYAYTHTGTSTRYGTRYQVPVRVVYQYGEESIMYPTVLCLLSISNFNHEYYLGESAVQFCNWASNFVLNESGKDMQFSERSSSRVVGTRLIPSAS